MSPVRLPPAARRAAIRPRARRLLRHGALVLALAALAAPVAAQADLDTRELFGWAEWVEVGESRLELKAKLDTGADTSSLDAIHINKYRSSGKRWVEFTVVDQETGRRVNYRKPLLREARIKRHEGPSQRRPVVAIDICLGDIHQEIEVSLIDRSEFLYPMLLGRSALAGIALVDPALEFTRPPDCARGGDDD